MTKLRTFTQEQIDANKRKRVEKRRSIEDRIREAQTKKQEELK